MQTCIFKSHLEKRPPSLKKIVFLPATLLHVRFGLVDIDLSVQQSGEMCRAGLSSFGHLQVVQLQPEV